MKKSRVSIFSKNCHTKGKCLNNSVIFHFFDHGSVYCTKHVLSQQNPNPRRGKTIKNEFQLTTDINCILILSNIKYFTKDNF